MGAFVSKRELGLLDSGDDQSQFSSPVPVTSAPSHFLPRELDPRSPTAGIDRTPIPVSAPPETVADPRSPSLGIVRTPIACLPPENGDVSMDILPTSECEDTKPSDQSPIPPFSHSDLDNSQVSDDANNCVSSKSKAVSHTSAPGEKSSNGRVSYALSPASNKLFAPSSPTQRSPLGTRNIAPRDSSTPRNIILRKQSAHVDKLRGMDVSASEPMTSKRQQQQLQSACDKENVS